MNFAFVLAAVIYLASVPFIGFVNYIHFDGPELVKAMIHGAGLLCVLYSAVIYIKHALFINHR